MASESRFQDIENSALPYIVHNAVYIFLFVLGDQRKYSEKSEICICLDPCILNRFSLFGPIWINISLLTGCLVETRNYSILSLAFIASSFRVTEENLVFETVQSGPYSSFECFLCSLRNKLLYFICYSCSIIGILNQPKMSLEDLCAEQDTAIVLGRSVNQIKGSVQ